MWSTEAIEDERKMGHETTYANENYFSNDSRYASSTTETGKQENNYDYTTSQPTKDIYL